VLSGPNASLSRLRGALANPEVVGMYYFGHGCFPDDAAEGYLLLAGQEHLYASDIEEINPGIRFVFLNACWGAAAGSPWDLEKKASRSVGHAFAEGNLSKVVIAPIWPLISTQAARAALTFFRQAVTNVPLAEALLEVRKESYQRYLQDEPDIGWMAYRYFG